MTSYSKLLLGAALIFGIQFKTTMAEKRNCSQHAVSIAREMLSQELTSEKMGKQKFTLQDLQGLRFTQSQKSESGDEFLVEVRSNSEKPVYQVKLKYDFEMFSSCHSSLALFSYETSPRFQPSLGTLSFHQKQGNDP